MVSAIDTNPCNYNIAALHGSAPGRDDLVKTFVQMIWRKYLNVSGNEVHLPFTPDKLISRLDKGPLRELYNSIFHKLHDHRINNDCRYNSTKSTNFVTKIWSNVNDWKLLVAKSFSSSQAILGELPLILNDALVQFSRDVNEHCVYILKTQLHFFRVCLSTLWYKVGHYTDRNIMETTKLLEI